MRLTDDSGNVLDAEFEVEPGDSAADIVLHARYGGKSSPRKSNVDYFPALELLLSRLGELGGVMERVMVDSKTAQRLAPLDRTLDLPFPIDLATVDDYADLRLEMTRAQRTIAREAGVQPTGGNNHKRIRMTVRLRSGRIDADALTSSLRFGGPRDGSVVGVEYRPANPDPSVSPAEVFTFDPATRERRLASHAFVQNSLAALLQSRGLCPRSPKPDEPDFDLAWQQDVTFVAEVKSLGGADEDRQLRMGLGQVLHYRHVMARKFGVVRAVLALEYEPADTWLQICAEMGIIVTWPPTWPAM